MLLIQMETIKLLDSYCEFKLVIVLAYFYLYSDTRKLCTF